MLPRNDAATERPLVALNLNVAISSLRFP